MMIDKYNAKFYKNLCVDYINLYEHLLNCINGYDTIIEARNNMLEEFYMGLPTKFSSPDEIENYILNLILGLIEKFKAEKFEYYDDLVLRLNKVLFSSKYYVQDTGISIPKNGVVLQDIDYYQNYLKLKDILNLVDLITNSKTI